MNTLSKKNVIYGLRLKDTTIYRYIGYTTITLGSRLSKHKSDAKKKKTALHNWIMKYGPENIEANIIEECSLDNIFEREIYWIDSYRKLQGNLQDKTPNRMLNQADGGGGCTGYKWDDARKLKYSMMMKGKNHFAYGKKRSVESIQRQSATARERNKTRLQYVRTAEYREKQRLAHLGQVAWNKGLKTGPQDIEVIRNRAQKNTGKIRSQSAKDATAAKIKGLKRSEEQKARIAESAKNRLRANCVHCGIEATPQNLKRWHNDNCKLKNI